VKTLIKIYALAFAAILLIGGDSYAITTGLKTEEEAMRVWSLLLLFSLHYSAYYRVVHLQIA